MNTSVADPHWDWWIIWYFYLGGIAAGAYFLATLAELFGTESRRHTRVGYLVAAPLIGICGILLIVDLDKPSRFWHMLFDAESGLPHLKFWSPMSIGAWAIFFFSIISSASFVGMLAEMGWLGRGRLQSAATRLHHGFLGDTNLPPCSAMNHPMTNRSNWRLVVALMRSGGSPPSAPSTRGSGSA